MNSSDVLMIGADLPLLNPLGAGFVRSLTEARAYVERHVPAVVVFGGGGVPGELERFATFLLEHAPEARWILLRGQLPITRLLQFANFGPLHGLVDSLDDPGLEDHVRAALERHDEVRQKRKLEELSADQELILKRLTGELETRVKKRHRGLSKSLAALDETKSRMHVYHAALLAIHRAGTIHQMETALIDSLRETIPLESVEIRSAPRAAPSFTEGGGSTLFVELSHAFSQTGGEAHFVKKDLQSLTTFESEFLLELCEAISLALARLQKLDQAEILKTQWQATFDSIPHALCLLGPKHEILKLNRAFAETLGSGFRGLLGQNGFETFFGPGFILPVSSDAPFTFRFNRVTDSSNETFEVTGQKMSNGRAPLEATLVLFRQITEEVRFERRILNASKLAELGTIGSSIAHELNNPLGGMLSFLQLILMDLPTQHALHADIRAMEQAVFRCRDIVISLLSFSRKRDLRDFTELELEPILVNAVKLIELRTKSSGVKVILSGPIPTSARIRGSSIALVQAVTDVLQNAVDAVIERKLVEPNLRGLIEILVLSEDSRWRITIRDNGDGVRPELRAQVFNPLFTTRDPAHHQGMGLTTVFTILGEHHGDIELSPLTGGGTCATIRLPELRRQSL